MAEDGLSKPVDYTSRWSDQGRGRQPPLLGQLANRFTRMTGVIGLHAGFPPDSCFPVTHVQLTLCDGQQANVSTSTELALSQQYNLNAKGYPPLTDWAKQLTLKLQKPLCEVDTLMTSGATHALDMIFNTLLNPGDAMLCEEYTYSHGFDSLLIPNGYKLMPVRVDQHGLVPEHLAQMLKEASGSWSEATRPKLLYIIPTGHNPTGSVLPMERKQQIYKICQQYDLIIVEDDAYYWLQWGPDGSAPGLDLPPSFLSMDTDGRVIRVDTFAKTLGPGYRLGWVTAVPQVVNKLALASYGVVVGPCSFAQVAVHSMLQAWGEQGYDAFLRKLQRQYGEMAALAHSECERQLAGLAVWHAVQAGMFMWYRLEGIEDSDEVTDALIEQRVVVTPGKAFWTRRSEPGARCNYIRLCFVYVSKEELVEGIARLRTVLQGVRAKRMGAPAEPAAGSN